MNSFLDKVELNKIGFKKIGENVLISRKASIYSPENISIGNKVRIDDFCVISGSGGINIDEYVHISAFVCLFGGSGISIGRCSSISPFSALFSESDDFSGHSLVNPWFSVKFKPKYKKGKVVIDNFVNIGTHCIVMPKVYIAEGAAIGANSFVNKNCQPWSVYLGSPAKKIKERSRKLLELEKKFKADFVK
jgi:galactoside O-acetyltransferase